MKNSLYLARLSTMNSFIRNITGGGKKNQCPEIVYTTINGDARAIFTLPQLFTDTLQSIFLYFFSTHNSVFPLIAYFVSGNK